MAAHRTPRPGRRLLLTLLLALGLHLAGAILVHVLRPAAPARVRSTSTTSIREVEVVLLPPIRSRPPPPVAKLPRTQTRKPHARRRRRRPRLAPAPRADETGRRGQARPAGKEALPRLSLRMRPLDLSPSPGLFDREGDAWAARRRRDHGSSAGRATRRSEAQRVKARIDRWLLRDAGERNVKLGRAHPAIFALLRRVERRFAPTEAMVSGQRHAGRELSAAYRAGIDTFNRRGRALPLDRWETGERSQQAVMPNASVNLAFDREVEEAGRKRSRRMEAEVCFDAAPGKLPVVTAVRGFNIQALDRHAIGAVRRAFAAAAMPTDLPPTKGCYRFQIRLGRKLPTLSSLLSCRFDAFFTDWDCGWAGKKHLEHQVRLIAVWPD